jgi:hypothetical protein
MAQDIRRIMGFDPGRINFAWAIYGPQGLEDHGVEEGCGDDIDNLVYFRERAYRLITKFNPDAVCIERYTLRPVRGRVARGAPQNTELVNLMIGIVMEICWAKNIQIVPITAATHKTWIDREYGPLDKDSKGKTVVQSYKEWEDLTTDHEADAANLAKFGFENCQWKG